MTNYKEYLEKAYQSDKEEYECGSDNKIQFLASSVFDFTTYDNVMDELLGTKMINVITCILNESSFEYQKNTDNYINYITMVNMPFLADKLDWGTSIRGAWFDDYGDGYISLTSDLEIQKSELTNFLTQMIEWVNE